MAHQQSLTDLTPNSPAPGTFVRDNEESEVMLLLEHGDEPAGDCTIPELGGRTVATENDCKPSEHVMEAAYVSTLNHRLDGWTPDDVVAMHEAGDLEGSDGALVTVYSFPESRIGYINTEDA